MTDKEKIRAEIERRYRENKADGYSDVCEELWDILSFIDSMQKEPVSNPIDFEKELYKAFGQVKDFTLCMRIAKRFYDIGKKSREPVSENLEEAVNAYIGYAPEVDECSSTYGKRQAFKAGAQWQKARNQETIETAIHHAYHNGRLEMKEQMMKDAVDNTCMVVGKVDDHINVRIGVFEKPHEIWHCKCDTSKFKIGDKVKVIVIKED